jgi:VWFA-related protein
MPAASAVGAEKPAPAAESAEIAVTLAEIPVEVMRGSDPVQGLTAADFEVTEKGKPLPIVACETADLGSPGKAGAPGTRPALSQAARRHLFLLFDFAFSRPERIAAGLAAARTFVASSLAPEDLVAVGVYLPRGELPLLLNFTSDRAAVDRTLATLADVLAGKDPPAAAADEADPLRLTGTGVRAMLIQSVYRQERNLARDVDRDLGLQGHGMGEFLIRNLLNNTAAVQQASVDAVAMDRIMGLAEAVAQLADALRPVTGRKYLSLFSEGFSISEFDRMINSVYDPSIGTSALHAKLRESVDTLRRAGWTVHAVDLGGARKGMNADGLFYLANETGGVLVEGTDHFAEGMGAALRRSASSYVLTVQADVPSDGAYHPLEVRLRQDRGHVKVNHRGGYFAPLPFRRQKDVQRLADAARLVAGDEERNELRVQAVAVPLHRGADSTLVAVVVEVPGEALLSSGASHVGVEVFGYALSEAGNSTDFFAQAVDLDRSKVGARLAQGGVRVLGKLNLAAGQHHLRLLVRDRGTGRLSVLSLPLNLAAPSTEAPSLAALFLSPPQDPWLLVRSPDTVFVLHDRDVQPAVHTTVPAAGEAQIILLGHGLTGKGQWIRGRILDAAGKAVEGGGLELQSLTPGGATGEPDLVIARLRAGTLPAGNYLLEVRLGNEARAVQAATARTFAVAAPKV